MYSRRPTRQARGDPRPGPPPGPKEDRMLLLIDNYDSFTCNLVHYLGELGRRGRASRRNDALDVQQAMALNPRASCSRPAPATRHSAGICLSLARPRPRRGPPLLGVCLGHQAIGQAFGGRWCAAHEIVHGKTGAHPPRRAGRCSRACPSPSPPRATTRWWWSARRLPEALEVTAELEDGTIMGLSHRDAADPRRAVPPREHRLRARPRAARATSCDRVPEPRQPA